MFWKKKPKEKPVKDAKYYLRETRSVATIIIVVFAFRSTFFEPFRIPTGSMIPTIAIGDFILVNKFAYGFKLPYSDMFGTPTYLTSFTPPKRGDVIVFKYPKDPSINYIKRVIGLPGDTLEIIDNVVYINGVPYLSTSVEGKDFNDDMDDKFKSYDFNFFNVKVDEPDNKKSFIIQLTKDRMNISNFPPATVPKGNYFVMGDNRDFSSDSRFWGWVPEENIKGRAMFVWFSWIIPFIDDNPSKIRLHRIGTKIN